MVVVIRRIDFSGTRSPLALVTGAVVGSTTGDDSGEEALGSRGIAGSPDVGTRIAPPSMMRLLVGSGTSDDSTMEDGGERREVGRSGSPKIVPEGIVFWVDS